ncbi:MAG TPA: hypothetical protein VFO39_09565 [Candidatus Sulfotelmatobacter sp.]|nr:hypothetical protein [Candidatus Sulfotelmatobacter sp.]
MPDITARRDPNHGALFARNLPQPLKIGNFSGIDQRLKFLPLERAVDTKNGQKQRREVETVCR